VIRDLFRTALTGGTALGLTAAAAPVAILLSFRRIDAPDPLIRFWARRLLASAGVQVEVRGKENLPGGHCVFVCNHQSNFDVPVILASIERTIRFVAKAELYRIPLLAQAMRAVGVIKVDRTGSEADRRALDEALPQVREQMDVVLFAEGTRSEDGVLRPFKRGAAVLAINAGVPLVPLAVSGTRHIMSKGSPWIRGGRRAALVVGEQIPTAGKTIDDREALTEQAHAAVQRLLEEANAMVEEGMSEA
jgi:1-acyl-sn-glycerol-3-phosphate acyltransferase